jgi:RNase P/RNase MRP subunit p29
VSDGKIMTVATRDTLAILWSRLVALVGIEGSVVVETLDAVLVARRDIMQQVNEARTHHKVFRSWVPAKASTP